MLEDGLDKTLKPIVAALTKLAIDLEHADALPTAGQHKLLEYETRLLDEAERAWKEDQD